MLQLTAKFRNIPFFALLISLLSMSVSKAEIASNWQEGLNAKMRLIAATAEYQNDISNMAGVEISLTKGWKTYWRDPGETGIPPVFDWSKSTNLKHAEVKYPAPIRFKDQYGTSIGYKDNVVFPVILTPEDPTKDIKLDLSLNYAACEVICIPLQAEVSLEVPSNRSLGQSKNLNKYIKALPLQSETSETNIYQITSVQRDADGLLLNLDIKEGSEQPDYLFVEGPETWYLPEPEIVESVPGRSTYRLSLSGVPDLEKVENAKLRFTIVSNAVSVEQNWLLN